MPKTTVGYAHCPECNSKQQVYFDSRKHFIHCSECKTLSSYQSHAACARLLERMTPNDLPEKEAILPEISEPPIPDEPELAAANAIDVSPEKPEPLPKPKPNEPVKPRSFFDIIAENLI